MTDRDETNENTPATKRMKKNRARKPGAKQAGSPNAAPSSADRQTAANGHKSGGELFFEMMVNDASYEALGPFLIMFRTANTDTGATAAAGT